MRDLEGRLRRIEGQVGGIAHMVEQERPCVEILTQVHACRAALNAVALRVLTVHLSQLVLEAAERGGALRDDDLKPVNRAIAELVGACHSELQPIEVGR